MSQSSGNTSLLDVGVIIPAAGRGERAGGGEPKQFRPIRGAPMLLRAIRPFARHPRVREIVVAVPTDTVDRPPSWLADLTGDRLRLVAGGDSRAASVGAGLAVLCPECALVLVHDAARPFVDLETIDRVIARCEAGVGALAAVPVSDTLKRSARGSARVIETVDRSGLWRAQTPQGFPRSMLETAYARAGDAVGSHTDEASLVEAAAYPVEIVPGDERNIKVTTEEDFALAALLADL